MRTKTLLLTSALVAAGVVTAMAQDPVYSVNAVGYVNVDLDEGFKIVANPLNAAGDTLNDVLPNAGIGAQAFLWDGDAYVSSAAIPGVGWLPNLELPVGTSAFMTSTPPQTVTFVGEVPQGDLSVDVPAGLSLLGSPVPQAGTLDALEFPGEVGDQAFTFVDGAYVSTAFIPGVGWLPALEIGVAEGFFMSAASAKTWERTFSVND